MIVVGVDGSPSSIDALVWAINEAHLRSAELTVVATWDALETYTLEETDVPDEYFKERARERLRTAIEAAKARTPMHPVIHARVKRGHAAEVLIEASRDAELLAIGNRGHGGFVGMMLGSISHHCVAHATCPVVVVRHQK